MPNIELHGFEEKEAFQMKARVDRAMQEAKLGKEAITTIFKSVPQACDGTEKIQPFLRIQSSKEDHVDLIIMKLRAENIGVDVEIAPTLIQFIPAERMRFGEK